MNGTMKFLNKTIKIKFMQTKINLKCSIYFIFTVFQNTIVLFISNLFYVLFYHDNLTKTYNINATILTSQNYF